MGREINWTRQKDQTKAEDEKMNAKVNQIPDSPGDPRHRKGLSPTIRNAQTPWRRSEGEQGVGDREVGGGGDEGGGGGRAAVQQKLTGK